MTLESIAAIAFALAASVAIVFELALTAGAPWGEYAMGGAYPGRLPARIRVATGVQAVLLCGLVAVVLSAAGLALPGIAQAAPWLIWIPAGFSAVSLVLNSITTSRKERRIWAPVAAVMLASSLIVALT